MPDVHKNFAYSAVATAPSPATSGTSLVVAAGDGALFPTVPFNATVWPAGVQPLSTNAEVVRVTAISTDTLTITRAQESSTARSVVVGDQIAATVTAKTLTDAETAALPPQHNVTGTFGNFFLSSSNSFLTMANGVVLTEARLVLGTPLQLPYAITIDKVGCYIGTAGSAGALLRLGIYKITTANPYAVVLSSAWGTLLSDAGTMVATGTGQTTITLGVAQVIPAFTPFSIGFVAQGTPTTPCRIYRENSTLTGGGNPWGQNGILSNDPQLSCYVGSISGALPGTFTPTAFDTTVGAGAWFSRSA